MTQYNFRKITFHKYVYHIPISSLKQKNCICNTRYTSIVLYQPSVVVSISVTVAKSLAPLKCKWHNVNNISYCFKGFIKTLICMTSSLYKVYNKVYMVWFFFSIPHTFSTISQYHHSSRAIGIILMSPIWYSMYIYRHFKCSLVYHTTLK